MLLCVLASPAAAQAPQKKLIKCGADYADPVQIKAGVAAMEAAPVDGIIFRLPPCSSLFNRQFDMEAIGRQLSAANKIRWRRFTDNFIIITIGTNRPVDWFDDDAWGDALRNVAICARGARLAGCKGLVLDPEGYSDPGVSADRANIWTYGNQPQAGQKSFEQLQAQVRKRGAQFMTKVQEDLPSPVILALFLAGNLRLEAETADAGKRREALIKAEYGLLPSFLDGMLDAANDKAVICDGNEGGYGYDTKISFLDSYHAIHQRALSLISPENRRKYVSQVQCAQPVYADVCFGLSPSSPYGLLNAEQQMKFFQYELYHALKTSDQYVWLYSTRMDVASGRGLFDGLTASIQAIQGMIAEGRPLGFEVADFTAAARAAYQKAHTAQTRPAKTP